MAATRTLALFGASGLTGRAVIAAARERGWRVRVLDGPTSALAANPADLEIVRGDFSSADAIAACLAGTQAACLVFGPRAPYTDVFCAAATGAVIAAMKARGPRRLICQTGAMVGLDLPIWSLPFRWMATSYQRQRPGPAADRRDQEAAVRASGLDWTIVKPPRLTDGPRTGRVRVAPDLRIGLLSSVSRADLAEVILDAAAEPRLVGQVVFVSH
jgi:uncharacterized protein YbjT (DUF2867 family)